MVTMNSNTTTTPTPTPTQACMTCDSKSLINDAVAHNTNRLAVLLNNMGVVELEAGRLTNAYEIFSKASKLTTARPDHVHVDDPIGIYRYEWKDCAPACSCRYSNNRYYHRNIVDRSQSSSQQPYVDVRTSNEGMSPFLFLRALMVHVPEEHTATLESLCPCGYAWVVWYNLALASTVVGTRLGQKGTALLSQAIRLFQMVQIRIDAEPASNDWLLLQLAVTNNQAFIQRELAPSCCATLSDLISRLSDTLKSPCLDCEKKDWDLFSLNVIILNGQYLAEAA